MSEHCCVDKEKVHKLLRKYFVVDENIDTKTITAYCNNWKEFLKDLELNHTIFGMVLTLHKKLKNSEFKVIEKK